VDLKSISTEEALGSVGGLSMLWLLLKKIMLRTAVDNTAINSADAQSDVITLLREEVSRLGGANARLAEKLNAVQMENVGLRTEMSELRDKLNAMTEQLNILSRHGAVIQPVLDFERRQG
jgi:predicted nuclease with TOPRIM domain